MELYANLKEAFDDFDCPLCKSKEFIPSDCIRENNFIIQRQFYFTQHINILDNSMLFTDIIREPESVPNQGQQLLLRCMCKKFSVMLKFVCTKDIFNIDFIVPHIYNIDWKNYMLIITDCQTSLHKADGDCIVRIPEVLDFKINSIGSIIDKLKLYNTFS